jgi:hypothetical protein
VVIKTYEARIMKTYEEYIKLSMPIDQQLVQPNEPVALYVQQIGTGPYMIQLRPANFRNDSWVQLTEEFLLPELEPAKGLADGPMIKGLEEELESLEAQAADVRRRLELLRG